MARPFVLCVDDERDVTDLLRFLLARAGCDTAAAASGRAALAAVRARRPDLVLLDLMLPDLDGLGLCEILRRTPATAALPVVMLTAWSSDEVRAHSRALGALDHITKPFSPRELLARLPGWLEKPAEQ
jgi:two-component system alkaline phosphatase synthesis response regulator PhoP